MSKKTLLTPLITLLTLAGVSAASIPAQAQAPADEKPLTGAALSAAQKQVLAWYVTKDKIRASKGRRASFEGTTTPDFTFVFAPVDKTEVVAREEFFQKSGGGKHDPKAKDFLHDGPKAQPNRFVSRNGGKEIVLYEYPLLTDKRPGPADETGKPGAMQTGTTTFMFMEDFVKTPKGLLMKSLGVSHMKITVNGEAIPDSMLSGLTFAQFSGTDKTEAKPATPPAAASDAPPKPDANPPKTDPAVPVTPPAAKQ